jgi:predicted lipid-binding transport protein (Tim44 family)
MSDTDLSGLTPDQVTILTGQAEAENARLEEAASAVTQQAFNLGCLVGLLPGGIFVVATFLLIGFSVIGAAIALVLMLIGLIAFANLAAMLARRNTIRRVYRDQSQGEIETALQEAGLTRDQFDAVAQHALPSHAALYPFVTISNQPPARRRIRDLLFRNQDD